MATRIDVDPGGMLGQPFTRGEDEKYLDFVARVWSTCTWCQRRGRTALDNLQHQGRCSDAPSAPEWPEDQEAQPAGWFHE